MALGFAVGSRGADHNRSGAYEADFSAQVDRLHGTPDAAIQAVETEDRAALIDSLILCKFLRGVFTDLFAEAADLLRLVTSWDVSGDELRTTARRVVTAKKLFNQREGWTAAEDTLPRRFLSEGLPTRAPGRDATLPRCGWRRWSGPTTSARLDGKRTGAGGVAPRVGVGGLARRGTAECACGRLSG